MKKYNLSEIMHKAWKLYRKGVAAVGGSRAAAGSAWSGRAAGQGRACGRAYSGAERDELAASAEPELIRCAPTFTPVTLSPS